MAAGIGLVVRGIGARSTVDHDTLMDDRKTRSIDIATNITSRSLVA